MLIYYTKKVENKSGKIMGYHAEISLKQYSVIQRPYTDFIPSKQFRNWPWIWKLDVIFENIAQRLPKPMVFLAWYKCFVESESRKRQKSVF